MNFIKKIIFFSVITTLERQGEKNEAPNYVSFEMTLPVIGYLESCAVLGNLEMI